MALGLLMQALASDEKAKTLVDEEGNISFEYDLTEIDDADA